MRSAENKHYEIINQHYRRCISLLSKIMDAAPSNPLQYSTRLKSPRLKLVSKKASAENTHLLLIIPNFVPLNTAT